VLVQRLLPALSLAVIALLPLVLRLQDSFSSMRAYELRDMELSGHSFLDLKLWLGRIDLPPVVSAMHQKVVHSQHKTAITSLTLAVLALVALPRRPDARLLWLVAPLVVPAVALMNIFGCGPLLYQYCKFNVMTTAALGMLAAYGLRDLLRWDALRHAGRQAVLAGLLTLLLLAELALLSPRALPLPSADANVPSVYRSSLLESAPRALLEFPRAIQGTPLILSGLEPAKRYMYYQTVHGRPISAGLGSYVNPYALSGFQLTYGSPLGGVLRRLQGPPDAWPEEADLDARALVEAGFGHFVLHGELLCEPSFEVMRALLTRLLGEPALEADGVAVWELEHRVLRLGSHDLNQIYGDRKWNCVRYWRCLQAFDPYDPARVERLLQAVASLPADESALQSAGAAVLEQALADFPQDYADRFRFGPLTAEGEIWAERMLHAHLDLRAAARQASAVPPADRSSR